MTESKITTQPPPSPDTSGGAGERDAACGVVADTERRWRSTGERPWIAAANGLAAIISIIRALPRPAPDASLQKAQTSPDAGLAFEYERLSAAVRRWAPFILDDTTTDAEKDRTAAGPSGVLLRKVVDLTFGYAFENESVPSTDRQTKIIAAARAAVGQAEIGPDAGLREALDALKPLADAVSRAAPAPREALMKAYHVYERLSAPPAAKGSE